MDKLIGIEVVYAAPEKQKLIAIEVEEGTTVMQAIEASGIKNLFDHIEVNETAVGIFGRKVPPSQVLKQGDRVEIYRPLIADPKEVRRQRALMKD